jgi:nucleotide-binding universal stress UspA family protein
MTSASGEKRVVVGVDGSPHSMVALGAAIEEAQLRGANLKVVYAFPAMVSFWGSTAHEYYPQVEKDAHEKFEEWFAQAPSMEGIEVERTILPGNPSEVLIDESQSADLLVIGSRGRGGFRGMLMGSVSMHCAQGAHCPVLIVRGA